MPTKNLYSCVLQTTKKATNVAQIQRTIFAIIGEKLDNSLQIEAN